MARLEKAKELYDAKLANYFVLSGGVLGDETISEAQVMKTYLLQQGMPDKRLILETQSTNTIDNLYYSKLVMDSLNCQTAYLVTSKSHLCRAMLIAERCGVDAIGVPERWREICLKFGWSMPLKPAALFTSWHLSSGTWSILTKCLTCAQNCAMRC
jgi:uncharacterized SAM-binding protein YcdF (DUF218 family)